MDQQLGKIGKLLAGCAMVTVAACSRMPVTERDFALEDRMMAPAWQASAGQPTEKASEDWLNRLKSPALTAFIQEVMTHNPNIQATAHRMVAAGFNAAVADGNLYPTLNATARGGRQKLANATTSNTTLRLGLDARWEADVWGRLSAQIGVAEAAYQASQYDLAAARLSLAAQVAQNWFDVIEAQAQESLARETVISYEQALRVVRQRFQRGLNSGLDLRLVVSNLEAARASLNQRQFQLGEQKRRLEVLAGRYPEGAVMTHSVLPDLEGAVPAGLPMTLLERRPDIQAAKARLLEAGYSRKAADQALLPTIAITASGNNSSDNFSDLLKFDDLFWTLLGNITQPLFEGGKLRNRARAEQALFEAEKQNYAQQLLVAFKEVEDSLSAERALKARVVHTKKAAENAQAAEAVALDQYGRGLIRISVLLESQRQNLAQQSQFLLIKKQLLNNRIALYLALGGDFSGSETTQQTRNNKEQKQERIS